MHVQAPLSSYVFLMRQVVLRMDWHFRDGIFTQSGQAISNSGAIGFWSVVGFCVLSWLGVFAGVEVLGALALRSKPLDGVALWRYGEDS